MGMLAGAGWHVWPRQLSYYGAEQAWPLMCRAIQPPASSHSACHDLLTHVVARQALGGVHYIQQPFFFRKNLYSLPVRYKLKQ